MSKCFCIFLLVLILSGIRSSAQYHLVWQDEFDYNGHLDSTKWNYETGGDGWGNEELQYYTGKRLKNARVENGRLIIEAHKENYGGKQYTSARVTTTEKGDWTYGRIEVKAKLPSGRGTWPAIWMLPTEWIYGDGSWPDNGEIDIMEHVGYNEGVIHGTVHTDDYNHMEGTQKGDQIYISDATSAFHVYSIEWTKDKIRWFVDDEQYFRFIKQGDWSKWPFDHPFHLILNVAVGGSWGGVEGVDNSIFPTKMEIDYVRVYQKEAETGIDDQQSSDEVKIYPIPVEEFVHFSSYRAIKKIEIFSLTGKAVYKNIFEKAKKQCRINLSHLPSGLYLAKFRFSDNRDYTAKIIKN